MIDVRVIRGHNDRDYHEWITYGDRIRANRLGYPNPRMYCAYWTLWFCNNTECPAQALVNDDAVRNLIDRTNNERVTR